MKKTTAIVLIAIITVSSFTLVASAVAMPFMHWQNIPHGRGWWRNTPTQSSSVRLIGSVDQWGTTEVNGTLTAQTRTIVLNNTDVRQGSSASAIWTTNNSRPINAIRAKENFTYTFYTARLVAPNVSALDYNNNDFFLNGTWNVWQVTSSFNITTDANGNITGVQRGQNAVPLATAAYGELKVNGDWTTFTLTITGVNPLTGTVHAQRISSRMFNPFKINNDNTDVLTTADVAAVARAYGSMPGWGNYDQRMDYNFDYKIDICDITTAASNLNS